MKISYIGHSCFVIESGRKKKILTDPFDRSIDIPLPSYPVDIVTVSHDHFDHAYVRGVAGYSHIVRHEGETDIDDINIKGISSPHDGYGGNIRGTSIIFIFNIDGVRVVHLGDLGEVLSEKQCAAIGRADILMVPVGGTYTLDASQAIKVSVLLKAGLVIPMHYKTPMSSISIAGVEPFLACRYPVMRRDVWEGTREDIPEELTILHLKHAGQLS